jgi:branched-chain amino acid transport system ATP-binding protein
VSPPLLSIEDVAVSYGGVQALDGVSLEIGEKDIVAVLGANGAGKTTLLRSISRLSPLARGTVRLAGQDLSGIHPSRLASLGVAHVPEGRRVFSTLTVEENLDLGAFGIKGNAPRKTKEWILRLFPILGERRRQLAGTLSGGEQQMMVIGRGLMSKPRLLLLDEPSLGLAPIVEAEIFRIIRQIHEEEGVSILLVEQNARRALLVSRYAYILEVGRVAIQGDSAALRNDERVHAAYLGGLRKAQL